MDLEIVFLGTTASIPTARRSLASIAVRRGGDLMLFDCGEGAQRNLLLSGLGVNRKTTIFVTHLHGDHIFGIPGLIHSMSLLGRKKPLEVYGVRGIGAYLDAVLNTVHFNLAYRINVTDVGEGLVCERSGYRVIAARTDHGVENLSYALVESDRPGHFHPEKAIALKIPKGPLWRKLQYGKSVKLEDGRTISHSDVCGAPRRGRCIVYSGDTVYSKKLVELARDADILICDSTYGKELKEKAVETRHSTAEDAAKMAKNANVGQLILTHISARYEDASSLLKQAKRIFPNVKLAEDLMRVEVPYPEE